MDRMVSSQPLGNQWNPLSGKKCAHENRISRSDGGNLYNPGRTLAPPNALATNLLRSAPEFHQLIDEQLHGMDSASRTYASPTRQRWQKNMIHTAGTEHGIVHTHGHAGTQQCAKHDRKSARRNFTDVEGDSTPRTRAGPPPTGCGAERRLRETCLDPQALDGAAVLAGRGRIHQDIHRFVSRNRYMVRFKGSRTS